MNKKYNLLFISQLHELVTLELGVRAQIAIVDEPAADLTVRPSLPESVVRGRVVIATKE
jgi:hypothetical protein